MCKSLLVWACNGLGVYRQWNSCKQSNVLLFFFFFPLCALARGPSRPRDLRVSESSPSGRLSSFSAGKQHLALSLFIWYHSCLATPQVLKSGEERGEQQFCVCWVHRVVCAVDRNTLTGVRSWCEIMVSKHQALKEASTKNHMLHHLTGPFVVNRRALPLTILGQMGVRD